jgi:hypothetical protein
MAKQYVIRSASKPRRYYYRDKSSQWRTTTDPSKAETFAYNGGMMAARTIEPKALPADKIDAELARITFAASSLEVVEAPYRGKLKVEIHHGCEVRIREGKLYCKHLNNPEKRAVYPYDHALSGVDLCATAAAEFLGTSDLFACGSNGGYVFLTRKNPWE